MGTSGKNVYNYSGGLLVLLVLAPLVLKACLWTPGGLGEPFTRSSRSNLFSWCYDCVCLCVCVYVVFSQCWHLPCWWKSWWFVGLSRGSGSLCWQLSLYYSPWWKDVHTWACLRWSGHMITFIKPGLLSYMLDILCNKMGSTDKAPLHTDVWLF